MLTSYLKIAFRNLFRHKSFSLISIAGLAASMSVCLLIILFVRHQLSFDRFHEKAGRIYHIYSDYKAPINNSSHLYATSPVGLGQVLQDELPAVEDFISLRRFGGKAITGKEKLQVTGLYATDSFFQVLDFPLIKGAPKTALVESYSLVLTETTAERLFGEQEAMGATLTVEGVGEFKVTGVVASVTPPTVFEFEALASFATLYSNESTRQQLAQWDKTVRNSYTLAVLAEGGSGEHLEALLPQIISRHFPGDEASHLVGLHAQKLTGISMGPIMDNALKFMLPAMVLFILAGIAGVILIAACFNYVGLSIARALKRAREVGVRKVVGARRPQIMRQFLVESVCISILALLFAILLTVWLMNGFNNLTPIQFTKAQISFNAGDFSLYLIFFTFSALVGIVSGLYPALYLSSFLPTVVLRGIERIRGRGFTLRKLLIVTQFALSLLFIVSTVLLYQQSEHVSKTSFGFNEKDILNVRLKDVPYQVFRSAVELIPGVDNISAASIMTGEGGRNDTWIESENIEGHEKGYSVWIDENFLETMEIPILAGQNFAPTLSEETESAVLLNEAAVNRLKLGTPIDAVGQIITIADSVRVQVIGVVADYRFFSALSGVDPLVLRKRADFLQVANIRFLAANYDEVVAGLKESWSAFQTDADLEFDLFEDQLADSLELKLMKDFLHIIALAAGFAILIAALGLLGMTAYMTQTRLKEVGVRKVLGASTASIAALLSKSFVKMILLAIVIAGPLAWYVNRLWLHEVGNRIDMSVAVFAFSILVLFIIALVTIGSQTVRAARVNPTEILQYE